MSIVTRPAGRRVRVTFRGEVIADSRDALELKEGGYPPVYYFPRRDVQMEKLGRTAHSTHCPYKGDASYYSIASAAPAQIRCGVTLCMPSGMGLTLLMGGSFPW